MFLILGRGGPRGGRGGGRGTPRGGGNSFRIDASAGGSANKKKSFDDDD